MIDQQKPSVIGMTGEPISSQRGKDGIRTIFSFFFLINQQPNGAHRGLNTRKRGMIREVEY